MKKILFVLILPLLSFSFVVNFSEEIYDALASDKEDVIKQAISSLEEKEDFLSKGYLGALLMKSAQFEFTPWSKLKRFKEGRTILEKQISIHQDNVELRFVRLMIQENCPSMLGYSDAVVEDAELVVGAYSSMVEGLQNRVLEYAKISKQLNESELK